MKVVKKVITGPCSYILELENGESETHGFEFVKEDGMYKVLGLEDRQILEEFLDTEGRKKRIIFRKEMLFQLQDVYVCECGGNMTSNGVDDGYTGGYNSYYDVIRYYKCEKCGEEYSVKTTYEEPKDEWS